MQQLNILFSDMLLNFLLNIQAIECFLKILLLPLSSILHPQYLSEFILNCN